ncbi:hypothetical protein KUTeg_007841 [Tegillarca granosa]|uniref:Fructose-2,6-bisphosphatase TIGAR n=1 Tax=Tegillarca granosa TaxID=220873 RepID=A0ABQ9FGC1_TEGGR|nr:hypothetical protein KUTeg_007841 [Tegillarca granosa]
MVVFSLTLVRHGETLYNRKSIIQGQTDIPLSNVGHHQARLVARRLENEHYTHIFSSDLARAHQTAQAIIEGNKMRKGTILKDKRLRERRFGLFEGKNSKEFVAAAKKANYSYPTLHLFTPNGAETISQLQERAQSFFRDLCKLLTAFINDTEENEYTPGSIKRRHGGSLGRNNHHTRNRLNNSHRSQSFCGITSITDMSDQDLNNYTDHLVTDQKRRRHEKQNSESDYVDENNPVGVISTQQNGVAFDNIKKCSNNNINSELLVSDQSTVPEFTEAPIERSDSNSSSGYSSLPESLDTNFADADPVKYRKPYSEKLPSSQDPCAVIKRSNQTTDLIIANEVCPNVTLSPMLSHRLSSVSSISSGRNSSFDDVDGVPPTIADVLVVTHGGLLKELIRHFVEDLDCKIQNKNHALKICPNCSISKFFVTLQDVSDTPDINCILLHDRDHLLDLDSDDSTDGKIIGQA